jgi:hypothetical protein
MRDKVAQTQDELLAWIQNLNPGLHTEHWKVLHKPSEPKGQRLILHKDRNSFAAVKRTQYKIFTGLSQGTVKVLKDTEAQQKEVILYTASLKLVSEGEGDDIPTPSDDRQGAVGKEKEIPLVTKSTSADQGTSLKGTPSDKEGESQGGEDGNRLSSQ